MNKLGIEGKVSPKGDARWRVTRSEKLWVVYRIKSDDKTRVIGYGVIKSIERSVYHQIGSNCGEWVRYENRYYPLHTPQEFESILKESKKLDYGFFNNEVNHLRPAAKQTKVSYFICLDEMP